MTTTTATSASAGTDHPPGAANTHQYGSLGATGRAASLVGGTLALAGAAKAKAPLAVPLAIGGAYLLYRGLKNSDPLAHALDLRSDRSGQILVDRAVTINRPVDDLYALWRNLDNLPRFMSHLESVTTTGDGRSHWVAKAPLGTSVEWDAELVEDRPNEVLAWRSLPGSEIVNEGRVTFREAPAGRGAEIRVQLDYRPPAGGAGFVVAALFGDAADQEVRGDLQRFKQLMETGEVATTKGQSSGRSPEHGDAWAQQRERQKRAPETDTRDRQPDDTVEEADEESFPASDAPGYAVGRDDEGVRR